MVSIVASGVPFLSYTYNNLNQLTAFSDAVSGKSVTLTYDANGNRITRTSTDPASTTGPEEDTYIYDRENRLINLDQKRERSIGIAVDDGAGNPEIAKATAKYRSNDAYAYVYDYRTRRVQRDERGTVTSLSFLGGTSYQEHDANTGDVAMPDVEYLRGSGMGGGVGGLLYTIRGGVSKFNLYNSRGDVVGQTDGTGALTYQASYEAFGTRTKEFGETEDRQKANTKDEDPTGLLNEGHRYRDLESGVFLTRDPLGFVDGPNMYAYVVQNPWTMFDPLGLEFTSKTRKKDRRVELNKGKAGPHKTWDTTHTDFGLKGSVVLPKGITDEMGDTIISHIKQGIIEAYNGGDESGNTWSITGKNIQITPIRSAKDANEGDHIFKFSDNLGGTGKAEFGGLNIELSAGTLKEIASPNEIIRGIAGLRLRMSAPHELGHTLGLMHPNNWGAADLKYAKQRLTPDQMKRVQSGELSDAFLLKHRAGISNKNPIDYLGPNNVMRYSRTSSAVLNLQQVNRIQRHVDARFINGFAPRAHQAISRDIGPHRAPSSQGMFSKRYFP